MQRANLLVERIPLEVEIANGLDRTVRHQVDIADAGDQSIDALRLPFVVLRGPETGESVLSQIMPDAICARSNLKPRIACCISDSM